MSLSAPTDTEPPLAGCVTILNSPSVIGTARIQLALVVVNDRELPLGVVGRHGVRVSVYRRSREGGGQQGEAHHQSGNDDCAVSR